MNQPGQAETQRALIFDHAVLVVADLVSAAQQFSAMGFTVTPGGVHAGQLSHNALISFGDGSYIELLAAYQKRSLPVLRLLDRLGLLERHPAGRTPLGRRFVESLLIGPGINDFALGAVNLDHVLPSVRERGLELDGPALGGRVRPDQQQISWRTACPRTRDLPFLIDDVTPRNLRVPEGQATQHINRASGVAAISIAVADLAASTARYRALLRRQPEVEPGSGYTPPGAAAVSFSLQAAGLVLEQAGEGAGSLRRQHGSAAGHPQRLWLHSPAGAMGLLTLSSTAELGYSLSNQT